MSDSHVKDGEEPCPCTLEYQASRYPHRVKSYRIRAIQSQFVDVPTLLSCIILDSSCPLPSNGINVRSSRFNPSAFATQYAMRKPHLPTQVTCSCYLRTPKVLNTPNYRTAKMACKNYAAKPCMQYMLTNHAYCLHIKLSPASGIP